MFHVSRLLTDIGAIGLVGLIHAVRIAVAAVGVGPAPTLVALKRVVPAVVVRRGDAVVLDAVLLVDLQLHAVRASAHAAEGRSREAEVAAAPVWHRIATTVDTYKEKSEAQSHFPVSSSPKTVPTYCCGGRLCRP